MKYSQYSKNYVNPILYINELFDLQFSVKMTRDVFGRSSLSRKSPKLYGPAGIGYKLTADGHFDIENRRLCNIANPVEGTDAINLNFHQSSISHLHELLEKITTEVDILKTNVDICLTEFQKLRESSTIVTTQLNNHINESLKNIRKELTVNSILHYNRGTDNIVDVIKNLR